MKNPIESFSINIENINYEKLSTDSLIDNILDGGFEKGIVTTIYGPASSGKTNLCILSTVNNAKKNKKIMYIDSEGGFSLKRVQQILGLDENNDYLLKQILNNITLVKPKTFKDQTNIIYALKDYLKDNQVDAIIIDSIGMLYRLDRSDLDIMTANYDLSKQINFLHNIAEEYNIPVIVTNQVYALFDQKDKVRVVGGDIITYSSKCLIELAKEDNYRKIILKKHRHLPEKEDYFMIYDRGIKSLEEYSKWQS